MLGKNPLATTPLATLAGGTQSISIPASLVATGSAGGVSLFYEIKPGTSSAAASAFAPFLGAGVQDINIPASIVVTGSVGSLSLIYRANLGVVSTSAPAFTPALKPTLSLATASAEATAQTPQLIPTVEPTVPVTTATAFDPGLIAAISLPQPEVAPALAGQVSLQASVVTQAANSQALVFDPDITPVPTVIIDAVSASAAAVDPALLASLIVGGAGVAAALAENVSLIPTLELNTAAAVATCSDPSLINNLTVQAAQTAQAFAETPTLNLNVVVDNAALATANAYDLQILPRVFLTTVSAIALQQDLGLSGSIFLQYAPAIAVNGQINLQYSASLGTAFSLATSIDPLIQLQIDLGSSTVALASALAPTASLSVVPIPTAVNATAHDPHIIYDIQLSTAAVSAAAAEPALQLDVLLAHAPSFAAAAAPDLISSVRVGPATANALAFAPPLNYNIQIQSVTTATAVAVNPTLHLGVVLNSAACNAAIGAIDLISFAAIGPANTAAIATNPSLVYNIHLQPSAVATATAISPTLQLGVVLTPVPSSATAGDISLIPFVTIGTAISTALTTSPSLNYNIITSTATAIATINDPSIDCSINIGQAPLASASAISPSLLTFVKPTVAVSYAGTFDPGLVYFIQTPAALAACQAVNPALQLSVVLNASTVATAIAIQPSVFATVDIIAVVAQALAIDPSYTYSVSLPVAGALAYSTDPQLEYNILQSSPALALALSGSLKISRTAGDYYIDPVAGNDTNDGLSWATAWKTMTFGATEPRTIPGDLIRIAKTDGPVAIGCLWTSGSKSVVLSAARTLGVDDCESGWTAVNGSTVNHMTSSKKQGTACVGIDVPTYTPNTAYAYKTISSVDASTYQGLSFWYRVESGVVDAGRWELCLCSDTLGTTIVDRFLLPGHPAADRWMPLNILRSGSGNLGATIQSIALYTTATPPASPHVVLLDNIQATRVGDLNLTSLISKNGSPTGENEGFWGIQSISGSTVLLDRDTNCDANSGFGYYGATEDVPTYIRETYKIPPAATMLTSSLFNVNNSGGPGAHIIYSGGWNTGSNVQDGQTYYDGQNGLGVGLYVNSKNFVSASRMSFYRFGSAFYAEGECVGHDISIPNASNCSNTAVLIKDNFILSNIELGNVNSNGSPDVTGSCGVSISNGAMDNVIGVHRALSNQNYGVSLDCVNNVRLTGPSLIANNECGVRVKNCGAGIFVEDATFDNINVDTSNESSRLTLVNTAMSASSAIHFDHSSNYGYSQKTLSHNHDSTGTNLVSHGGGLITSMATTRPGGSGLMWQLLTSDPVRNSFNPLPLYAGQVYCLANTTTTVKAWLRKDHATQVDGRLAVRGRQLAGISNDVTAVLANNTGWQELSISLTPTESGVIQIEVWAEYVSGHQSVYYDQGLTVV